MVLTNAEVDAFNASLRDLRDIDDREKIEAILQDLASQLRVYERQVEIASSLSAYDRRIAHLNLNRLAINLASARQLKAPRKAFSFSSRKYIRRADKITETAAPKVEYIDEYVTSNFHNERIHIQVEAQGVDYIIRRCTNSRIVLPTNLSTLYIDDCTNCIIFCSSISGALHMERCTGVSIVSSCHQLRIHHTKESTFIVATGSSPIIEHCTDLCFAPLLRSSVERHTDLICSLDPKFEGNLLKSGLNPALDETQCINVRDFSWLKAGNNPHYKAYLTPDAPELKIDLEEILYVLINDQNA